MGPAESSISSPGRRRRRRRMRWGCHVAAVTAFFLAVWPAANPGSLPDTCLSDMEGAWSYGEEEEVAWRSGERCRQAMGGEGGCTSENVSTLSGQQFLQAGGMLQGKVALQEMQSGSGEAGTSEIKGKKAGDLDGGRREEDEGGSKEGRGDKLKKEHQQGEKLVRQEVESEWIVRFREYRNAGQHFEALVAHLGQPEAGSWGWVERRNPAVAYPTDFGVVTFAKAVEESLKQQLMKLPSVKDLHPQMKFTRILMVADDVKHEMADGKGTEGTQSRHKSPGNCEGKAGSKQGSTADGGTVGKRKRAGERSGLGKARGRLHTRLSWGTSSSECEGSETSQSEELKAPYWGNISLAESERRRLLQVSKSQITALFEAEKLWARGFSGAGVRMAVFDTGVRQDHPHFRNIKERTNWTNEDTLNDSLGHGTFVAGVIAGQDSQCRGFAPDAEIYAFRVFTNAQVSYTSWFLDAFNYAMATRMHVLNLSIGGPDYLDRPFVEKVWELTANNIIMVSAIGNDGPLYGTLNNPADQMDVIGVGGIDYSNHIASFSSRGMSTWELPHGYGRVKPDVVAYGREVVGSKIGGGCKSLSGTSVASPVVAGAVCLLASVVPETKRWEVLNPASMKQALVEGALRLDGPHMYEQGAGRLNLLGAYAVLASYRPRASIFPAALDLTDCPYAWPFCRQPLYSGAMPLMFNATILNGMGVVGWLESPPIWEPTLPAGKMLDVQFTYSDVIWPWTGYLGLYLRVKPEGQHYSGSIEGEVSFTVVSPPGSGEVAQRKWTCKLPLKVAVIPTPPRAQRILWDQFHSIHYPPGYIPRDSLDVRNDILDWHGDHPHTNYHGLYDALRERGYFVEILGSPFTCFDARQYGTLLLVDLEDHYFEEEVEKLRRDVQEEGLGLIVFAEWYHVDTMVKMKFFDDNTRSWWTPATGGANIPALNLLLAPHNIAFGDSVLSGLFSLGGERAQYSSGTDLRRFPKGGFVHRFLFHDTVGTAGGMVSSRSTTVRPQGEASILGLCESGRGRIAVFGDSNCLDSSHMVTACYWLLKKFLSFTTLGERDATLFASVNELLEPLGSSNDSLPQFRTDVNLSAYSAVLGHELICGSDAPLNLVGTPGLLGGNYSRNTPSRSHAEEQIGTNDKNQKSVLNTVVGMKAGHPTQERQQLGPPKVESERLPGGNRLEKLIETGNFTAKAKKGFMIPTLVDLNAKSTIDRVHVTDHEVEDGSSQGRITERAGVELNEDGHTHTWIGKNQRLHFTDELDATMAAYQWSIPLLLCIFGFLLLWSLWRLTQGRKRRRLGRKLPAGRGLLSSI